MTALTDERVAARHVQSAEPSDEAPARAHGKRTKASGAERVARERAEIASIEKQVPLRRRLLEELAQGPRTPKALTQATQAATESVSRQLKELQAQALVQMAASEGDRRLRPYALTRAGEVQLSRHRAFGSPKPLPPKPTDKDAYQFLCGALLNAVRMRRHANRLSEAGERLEIVLKEAESIDHPELALEATVELATTLRQNRLLQQVREIVNRLNEVALGRNPHCGPALALPAAAHLAYTLGRLPGEGNLEDLKRREEFLTAARQFYAQIASASPAKDSGLMSWRHREAWSVVSRASNLRAQSRFESALKSTDEAATIFEELDDAYGIARCLFMRGFCLRLIGDFGASWQQLQAACELAKAQKFERFVTDALTQMGEVRRCQGLTSEAHEILTDALKRAASMKMVVAEAFAQSAIGAVEYQADHPEEARAALRLADGLFVECDNHEGLALNARRQAVVARALAREQRGGELSAARRFAAQALRRYLGLRSPAGVAACEIERARISIMHGQKPTGLQQLVKLLGRTRERELVERDPWVPTVLLAFAEEAGDDGLQDQAQRIAAASKQLQVDWRRREARAASSAQNRPKRRRLPQASFEMGGETRRELQPA